MDFSDVKKEIELIRKTIISLQFNGGEEDLNEANTRAKLVSPLLQIIGYKFDWLSFENHIVKNKAIADITVKKNGKILLIVEVKKALAGRIDIRDLHQLTGYLQSKNVEWGILTNGIEYLLVNNQIKGEFNDKEVLRFNVFDDINENIVGAFTYISIFENRKSYFDKYLQQFKVFMLKEKKEYHSWTRYNDTLEKYFNYIFSNFGFRELRYLSHEDFINFNKSDILESQNRKDRREITKLQTIKNRYFHIITFYDLFIKNGILTENPIKYNRSFSEMKDIYGLKDDYESEPLTIGEVKQILNGYDDVRKPEMYKLMFLLCLYGGLRREDIIHLKISDIDFDDCVIKFSDRSFVFPQSFMGRLQKYLANVREKGFNSDYFFIRNYSDYTEKPIAVGTPNDIIKKASKYLSDNGRNIQINPEKLKGMLVKKLFEVGFPLEEIIVISGVNLSSLHNYISNDEIIERTKVENLELRHPYKELY